MTHRALEDRIEALEGIVRRQRKSLEAQIRTLDESRCDSNHRWRAMHDRFDALQAKINADPPREERRKGHGRRTGDG